MTRHTHVFSGMAKQIRSTEWNMYTKLKNFDEDIRKKVTCVVDI